MPERHARFSPSSADRHIHCPPSLTLGEQYGLKDTSTVYTREGTEAHALGEYLLRQALGQPMEDPRPTMQFYNQEMQDAAEGYRDTVLELLETVPGATLYIEQEVDFSEYVQGSYGTSDAMIIGSGKMLVIDLKYGRIEVSAEENSQLKCYALGAFLAFSPLYDITSIDLIIYQPRIGNFSRWELTTEALLTWADMVLRPAGRLALTGGGEQATGPWCRFCKAKAVCRKRAEENLALARYDFARPPVLEDDEVNLILGQLPALETWASDIREYALQRAIGGYAWDDWKLVEGRTTRRFTDEEAVAKAVQEAGFDPYERKLLGITALTALLGKARFNEIVAPLMEKSQGTPTLAPRSDKRPEFFVANNITSA